MSASQINNTRGNKITLTLKSEKGNSELVFQDEFTQMSSDDIDFHAWFPKVKGGRMA